LVFHSSILWSVSSFVLRHRDLRNYRVDLFEKYIFRKLMVRHWCRSPLFLLSPKKAMFLT